MQPDTSPTSISARAIPAHRVILLYTDTLSLRHVKKQGHRDEPAACCGRASAHTPRSRYGQTLRLKGREVIVNHVALIERNTTAVERLTDRVPVFIVDIGI